MIYLIHYASEIMSKTLDSQFALSDPARSLTEWTTEILRQAILDGYFQPGERLDQDAIAKQLEVSRTPLREAIAALESEGLLESKPYRGAFVSKVTTEDIREVFALRALLEAEVVRQCTCSIPGAVLDELERMLKGAQKAYRAGNHAAQFEADRRFHETLRSFAESKLLKEVLDGVNNRISVVRRFAQMRPGPHVNEFAREHFAILEAMQQRDPGSAAALMKQHLENSQRRVEELRLGDP
jgi:DNA-binding GntR family transcriptional regulator